MSIPEVMSILDKIKTIHEKKNADYAAIGSPYENFTRSAELQSWFANSIDKSFAVLVGTKLARLSTLLNSGNEPNNESIEDSFLDLATYCILWSAYHQQLKTEDIICPCGNSGNLIAQIGYPDISFCGKCSKLFNVTTRKYLNQ